MKKQLLFAILIPLAGILWAQDTIEISQFVTPNGFVQVDHKYFPQVVGRYYSFIAAGHDLTAPMVNNISVDVASAKFSLTGAAILDKEYKWLLNAGFSADKDGNLASLFSDYKSGGTFTGELNIMYRVGNWYKFSAASRRAVQPQIRRIEGDGIGTLLQIYRDKGTTTARDYETLKHFEDIYADADAASAYQQYVLQQNNRIVLVPALDDAGNIDEARTKQRLKDVIDTLKAKNPDYNTYRERKILSEVIKETGRRFKSEYNLYLTINPGLVGNTFGLKEDGSAKKMLNIILKNKIRQHIKFPGGSNANKGAAVSLPEGNEFFESIYELEKIATYSHQLFLQQYVDFKNSHNDTDTLPAFNPASYHDVLRTNFVALDSRLGSYRFPYNAVDTLTARIEKKKLAVYNAADWTAIHLMWLGVKQKIGGSVAYTFKPDTALPSPARPDSIYGKRAATTKNKVMNYSAAFELNYYVWNPKHIAALLNLGIGAERYNNLYTFTDKRDYSEQTSIKDSSYLPGRSNSYAKKYSAYVDEKGKGVIADWGLLLYGNVYTMFGATKAFGTHLMFDYRNNFKSGDDKLERLGLSFGLVGNVPNKDGKSIVGIEAYIKFSDVTNKGLIYRADMEGQSEIGITFNVPILSVPKAK